MRQILQVLLIIVLFSSCENRSGRNNFHQQTTATCICENDFCDYCVKVVGITDGDTFKGLTKDNDEIKFRIYGIDAPEKKQAFGTRSKQHFADLIFGNTVGIKVHKKDYFGRLVVWVYTPDGKDVSAEMIKAGMAWHFKKYDKSKEYAIMENEAKLKRVGLWVDKEPIAPWNFRKSRKKKK